MLRSIIEAKGSREVRVSEVEFAVLSLRSDCQLVPLSDQFDVLLLKSLGPKEALNIPFCLLDHFFARGIDVKVEMAVVLASPSF